MDNINLDTLIKKLEKMKNNQLEANKRYYEKNKDKIIERKNRSTNKRKTTKNLLKGIKKTTKHIMKKIKIPYELRTWKGITVKRINLNFRL